jgi:hypothetical protein
VVAATTRGAAAARLEKVALEILGQVAVPEAAPAARRGFRLNLGSVRKRG